MKILRAVFRLSIHNILSCERGTPQSLPTSPIDRQREGLQPPQHYVTVEATLNYAELCRLLASVLHTTVIDGGQRLYKRVLDEVKLLESQPALIELTIEQFLHGELIN